MFLVTGGDNKENIFTRSSNMNSMKTVNDGKGSISSFFKSNKAENPAVCVDTSSQPRQLFNVVDDDFDDDTAAEASIMKRVVAALIQ